MRQSVWWGALRSRDMSDHTVQYLARRAPSLYNGGARMQYDHADNKFFGRVHDATDTTVKPYG